MKFIWNIPVIAAIGFCINACNATTNEVQKTNAEESANAASNGIIHI